MYTRDIKNPPDSIIVNGKPVFGTFIGTPNRLDIRGVQQPFGVLPLPPFITNLRIRSNLSIFFCTDEYFGIIEMLDAKIFGFSEFVLWDRKTNQKFAYRHIMGLRRRLVPKNLTAASCATLSKRRYVRISWDKKNNKASVLFTMAGDSARPSISGAFSFDPSLGNVSQISCVLPAPVMRRCLASAQSTAGIQGSIIIDSKKDSPLETNTRGAALFDIRRAYYKLRVNTDFLTGIGYLNGKLLSFRISVSSIAPFDQDTYNENFLSYDGDITPLPPVVITRPYGIRGQWIIQDTESMIDLSFTPLSDNMRSLSLFILHTKYHTMYGTFNGALLTKLGQSLTIKDFPGIGKKHRLRM